MLISSRSGILNLWLSRGREARVPAGAEAGQSNRRGHGCDGHRPERAKAWILRGRAQRSHGSTIFSPGEISRTVFPLRAEGG